MSTPIHTAPDAAAFEKLFKGELTCQMVYGLAECGAPAQWKVLMSCCGGTDFFCGECFVDAATPQLPRGTLIKTPIKTLTDQEPGYFGCRHCNTVHRTWKEAVKESSRI